MNQSFNSAGVQFVWDATSLSLAGTCLRKYKYKMIDGWTPKTLGLHLRFGQHYATALEHYYKHVALGMSPDEATREVVWEALRDTWDRTEENPAGTPWDSHDNNKSRENLIRSIIWYLDEFKDDNLTVFMLPDGTPAVEHSFLLPVENDIQFSGHLDRLVNYAEGVWVMDQKTTKSAITSYYFDGYSPNHQMSMYSFAGQAVFAVPIRGVIIDAAQIAVGFTRFERGFTSRTKDQLDEWYDMSMELILDTQMHTQEKNFPMNPTACGNYGGCEFRGICSKSPSVRENFLKGDFDKTSGWDPAARR